MIITVTLNPAVDITIEVDGIQLGTVNRVKHKRKDPGGKGINVSKVIKDLNEKTTALGFIGGETGKFINDALNLNNIQTDFVEVSTETRENLKIVDVGNQLFTDINAAGGSIREAEIEEFLIKTEKWIKNASVFVLSGSLPQGINSDIYKKIICKANENNVPTILDAEGEALFRGIEAKPYLIKPNLEELEKTFSVKLQTEQEIVDFCKSIIDTGVKYVVVSMASKGSIAVSKDEVWVAQSVEVDVKSTVGAGDTMVAALAIAIKNNYSISEALRLSVAAATASISKPGTQLASLKDIELYKKLVKIKKL